MNLISIVVPVFNEEESLYNLFHSFEQQKGVNKKFNLEYIFIDGKSTDNSINVIKAFTVEIKSKFLLMKKDSHLMH